ncbi:MAG: ExbD/TolR family protein [Planctomycetota bacterium]
METVETERMQQTILRRLSTGRRQYLTLRMAPMIDMVFLLLIFFLVAAKWRPAEDFLPFQLGTAQARPTGLVKPEPLIIQITATQTGCQVRIGNLSTVRITNQTTETDLANLMQETEKCLLAQKRFATDPIEIVCDPELRWEHLAKIYNILYGAGLTDITFRMTE